MTGTHCPVTRARHCAQGDVYVKPVIRSHLGGRRSDPLRSIHTLTR